MVKRRTATAPTQSAPVSAPAAVSPGGARIPRHEIWLDLPGVYGEAGMKARVWKNYPPRYLAGLNGVRGVEALEEALRMLVLEHNGWQCGGHELLSPEDDQTALCEGGETLPDCQTPDFWFSPQVPSDLVVAVREMLLDAPLANSRFRMPKRPG